jgi:hypothetical protein
MMTTTMTNTPIITTTTSTITMVALLKRFYNQEFINQALKYVNELNSMYQQLVINDELHSVIEQVYIACDDVTKEIVSKFHKHQKCKQQCEHHHEESKKGGKGEEEEEGLSTKGRSPVAAVSAAVAAAATNNSSKSFVSSPSPSSSPTTVLTTGSESEIGGEEASGMHIDVDPSLIFDNNSIISPCSGDDDDRCRDGHGHGHGNDDEDEVEVVGDSNHEGYDDEINDEDDDNDDDSGGYSIDEINHLNKYSKEV